METFTCFVHLLNNNIPFNIECYNNCSVVYRFESMDSFGGNVLLQLLNH